MLGMCERPLRFSHIREAKLINRAVADSPGMAEVPLLEALLRTRSESRNIGSSSLKIVERVKCSLIGKIVIRAEVLLVIDPVIDPDGGLILVVCAIGNALEEPPAVRVGHKPKQIDSNRVLA